MPGQKKNAAASRSTDGFATYVYCVLKPGRSRSRASRGPKGLEGTTNLRELDAGDGFVLVVADAPLELYDAAEIDAKLRDLDWVGRRAVEHDAVVEHATKVGTVIPMKLFTIFAGEERALAHIRQMRRSLDRVIERIEGCEEWGLRIFFDQARAARAQAADAASRPAATGREFLLRKKALDDERRTSSARLGSEVDALYEAVAKAARRSQRRPVPGPEVAGRVLLDAVFLVPATSVPKVKTLVSSAAERLVDEGFDLTLSGPWPAYSFIGGT